MLSYKVTNEDNNQRVDVFVANKLKEVSRSFINQLCDEGKVIVGDKEAKPAHKLRAGDIVKVNFDIKKITQLPLIDIPIIYEDDDCIVIDKPTGMLTHSKGSFNTEATVASFIKNRLNGLDGNRAGIVHRLDRGTSGVIICAKNAKSQGWLQKQFSARKVKKTYLAIVQGQLTQSTAIIDMPIERHPKKPQIFRAGVNGKPATTQYKVLKEGKNLSLVELKPQTGRTHQLRVHLKKIGHPILGDILYGGPPADRLFLHAQELEITLPNKIRKVFKSQIPTEFKAIIN